MTTQITLERRYFADTKEWRYMLCQLGIPENQWGYTNEVTFTASDVKS